MLVTRLLLVCAITGMLAACKNPLTDRMLNGGGMEINSNKASEQTNAMNKALVIFQTDAYALPNADNPESPQLNTAQIEIDRATDQAALADSKKAGDHGYWYQIAYAGNNFLALQCRYFIRDIHNFNRVRHAFSNEITGISAATTSMMGIAGASAASVAIVAAAFGLGSLSWDNFTGTFLYQLDPSGVQGVIESMRDEVFTDMNKHPPHTRAVAVGYMQKFASTCTPPTIEAKINQMINDKVRADINSKHATSEKSSEAADKDKKSAGGTQIPATSTEGAATPRYFSPAPQ